VGVDLTNFAESVGDQTAGPAWIIGQQTRVKAPTGVRQVQAPSGIYDLQPDEMTVVCGAGTPINELQEALGAVGQYVNLPLKSSDSGTVGGALAQGHGDIYRLGRGALRDTLLQFVLLIMMAMSSWRVVPQLRMSAGLISVDSRRFIWTTRIYRRDHFADTTSTEIIAVVLHRTNVNEFHRCDSATGLPTSISTDERTECLVLY